MTTGEEDSSQPDRVRGEPSENPRPIFVVGCHRSGTSVLRQSLDSHPRISAGPEDPTLFWLSKTDTNLTRERHEGYGFDEAEWLGMVRGVVEKMHSRYAANQGKTRWAYKHPENTMIVAYLDKVFPDCQVVHIVRNPRDCLASNRRKFGKRRGPFYGRRWTNYVRSAETAGARLGKDRFKTIRYEDLVADPASVLKDVVEWLGEPWSEETLNLGGHTHRYPARVLSPEEGEQWKKIHTQSVGRGDTKETLVSLVYVRLKGTDLLKKFGYKIRLLGG